MRRVAHAGITLPVLGAASTAGTIVATVIFDNWLAVQNRISYGAVETGRTALYPEGHTLFGAISILSVILFAAIAITLLGQWTLGRRGMPNTGTRQVMMLVSGLLGGIGIPATAQFASLGFAPLIASVILMVVALRKSEGRTTSGSPADDEIEMVRQE